MVHNQCYVGLLKTGKRGSCINVATGGCDHCHRKHPDWKLESGEVRGATGSGSVPSLYSHQNISLTVIFIHQLQLSQLCLCLSICHGRRLKTHEPQRLLPWRRIQSEVQIRAGADSKRFDLQLLKHSKTQNAWVTYSNVDKGKWKSAFHLLTL